MRTALVGIAVLGIAALAFAGGGGSWWDIDDARMAKEIEIKVTKDGMHSEIEYHIDPAHVPPAVHAAMAAMYPGLPPVAAEKEWEHGVLHYELSVMKDGKKVEAMFKPDGTLHNQEIAIDEGEVPQAVKDAIQAKYGGGTVTQWEVIKDAAHEVVEYHVKLTEDGKKLKVIVLPNGFVPGAYYEVPAEIEVPAPPR